MRTGQTLDVVALRRASATRRSYGNHHTRVATRRAMATTSRRDLFAAMARDTERAYDATKDAYQRRVRAATPAKGYYGQKRTSAAFKRANAELDGARGRHERVVELLESFAARPDVDVDRARARVWRKRWRAMQEASPDSAHAHVEAFRLFLARID